MAKPQIGEEREKGCMCCEMDRAFEEVSAILTSDTDKIVPQRRLESIRTDYHVVYYVARERRA